MRISIIIPVLNEAERVGALVRYLAEQGGSAVAEVLVVDGGSQDATTALAEEAGAQVLYSGQCSRAAQMNLGACMAVGEVLYFVHADTWPPPSFAADILGEMRRGRQMLCYRYRFDSPCWALSINSFFTRFYWMWCQGGDKTFAMRKCDFWAAGGYDERYVVMEEYDFLRRARFRFSFYIIPKEAVVSARKYAYNSWWRVQWANAVAFTLFRRQHPPKDILTRYKAMLCSGHEKRAA